MTTPIPAPAPINWTDDASTFCTSCEIHLATTRRPICPVCLDDGERSGTPGATARSLADPIRRLHEVERSDPPEWYERHTLDHP